MVRYFVKKNKIIISIMMLVIFSFCATQYVNATKGSYGSPTPSLDVKAVNYNDTWNNPINSGMAAWTGTPTKVTVGTLSTSLNRIEAAQYNDSWYGLSTKNANPFRFLIQLNARTITADATDFTNFVKGTTVHELGHEFWLIDNPVTNSDSIMKYTNNFNKVTTPRQYDIDDVNAIYP